MWFICVEVEQETSAPLLKKILDPSLRSMIKYYSNSYIVKRAFKKYRLNCLHGPRINLGSLRHRN